MRYQLSAISLACLSMFAVAAYAEDDPWSGGGGAAQVWSNAAPAAPLSSAVAAGGIPGRSNTVVAKPEPTRTVGQQTAANQADSAGSGGVSRVISQSFTPRTATPTASTSNPAATAYDPWATANTSINNAFANVPAGDQAAYDAAMQKMFADITASAQAAANVANNNVSASASGSVIPVVACIGSYCVREDKSVVDGNGNKVGSATINASGNLVIVANNGQNLGTVDVAGSASEGKNGLQLADTIRGTSTVGGQDGQCWGLSCLKGQDNIANISDSDGKIVGIGSNGAIIDYANGQVRNSTGVIGTATVTDNGFSVQSNDGKTATINVNFGSNNAGIGVSQGITSVQGDGSIAKALDTNDVWNSR